MKANIVTLLTGVIFGIGLCFAGMGQPSTVVGFLDFFGGQWDPSLALLMAAGIPVTAVGYWLTRRRKAPVLAPSLPDFTNDRLTGRLVVGSALFGAGWAIGGRCPAPGVLGLATALPTAFLFFAAMAAGMYLFTLFERLTAPQAQPRDETGHSLEEAGPAVDAST